MVAMTRLHAFANSTQGQKYHFMFEQDMQSQHRPEERMPEGFLTRLQQIMLRDADPTYMGADVADLIDVARETWTPEPIRLSDPYTPNGFILFPRPIMVPDSDAYGPEATVPVRAISWFPVTAEDDPNVGCFWISFYTHADDDLLPTSHASIAGIATPEKTAELRRIMPLAVAHTFQWSFGDSPWNDDDRWFHATGTDESARARGIAQVTLVQAIWRIAAQFIRTPRRAPRQIWKDARRKGIDRTDVTIITLRRLAEDADPDMPQRDEGGLLTVQFIVRGHWHKYHTNDGLIQRWILPYVKGPEGAPFRATRRVFEFTR
jgi:hypothetical protein